VDSFIHIINENDVQPEEIEKIKAKVWPITKYKFVAENRLETDQDYNWHVPYAMACAAYRIDPTRWMDREVKEDPRIRKFMQRVEFEMFEDRNEFRLAKLKNRYDGPTSTEVVARGKTFARSSLRRHGEYGLETRMTDEEIIQKFMGNVSRLLSSDRATVVAEAVFKLEKLEEVAELLKMIAP